MTRHRLDALIGWCDRRPVRAVLVVYALSRLVALAALAVAASRQSPTGVGHLDPGLLDMFGLWDGEWYDRIAREGYPRDLPLDPVTGRVTYNAWAFYPLLPALLAPFAALGLPTAAVGAVLGLGFGAVAAVLAHRLLLSGPAGSAGARGRWALLAVAVWCLLPATPVLLQPYTEAPAAALLFGALLAIRRGRLVLAGALSLVLGLTRAVAPALAVVVVVALVLEWRTARREGRPLLSGRRRDAAFLLGSVGVSAVLWPVLAGVVTGVPTAFLQTQAAWGQRPGEGPYLAWLEWAWTGHGLLGVAVLLGVVAAYLGLVLGRYGEPLGPVLRAFAVAYPLYLLAVVAPITSLWRFALLDLPLCGIAASLALGAGRRPARGRLLRVGLLLALLVGGVLVWTVELWTFEPFGSSPP